MASTNKTANFNLPQWQSSDKPVMQDFNDAFKNLSDAKGAANGIAGLGSDGIVPLSQQGIVSGSNANGSYIKYPDGTMICTFKGQITTGGTYGDWAWEFPVSFVSTDDLVISEPMTDSSVLLVAHTNILNTYNVQLLFYNPADASRATSKTFTVSLTAIGRWK